ncbi:hypothetical protein [Pontimicrobium sp. IMCC45349]|uniref:hypothetical protein n=1 Tax=Pontimicrobium sp. IMCC45349 TaxID=3391574 RepID=UPI00399FFCAC
MKKGVLISIIGIIIVGITYFGIEMYGFAKGVKKDSQKQIGINKTEHIVQKEQIGEEKLNICKKQSENGIIFETCIKKYNLFTLKSSKGDVLYKNDNNPSEYILKDFNEDGFLDIELHFMTNVPDVNEILIFNPELKKFIEIVNFSSFPASIKIKNTNYYYSYHRSGCADSNWDSDLYILKENKAVKIGNIHAIECENEDDKGIYIYKVNGENKKQLKLIPIEKKDFGNKWEFIEKYWTENYNKFE